MALHFVNIPVTPFQQNCTLLWTDSSNHGVLVDLGGDIEMVQAVIQRKQLNIQAIWLTHGHLDHVSGVEAWQQQFHTPILGPHIDDQFWIEQLPQITQSYGFKYANSFTPDQWLQENDLLSIDEYQFKVLHIPGHTPGSVVFYCEQEKLLIAGDVLFRESIGRTDFPRSSNQDLIHNIHHKLLILPDDTKVITGHGPLTTIGYEKQYNPFL